MILQFGLQVKVKVTVKCTTLNFTTFVFNIHFYIPLLPRYLISPILFPCNISEQHLNCNILHCYMLIVNITMLLRFFQKHHYRELSLEAQKSLGEIPEKFTEYWLTRFPRLLCHVWCAMQSFRVESSLKQYYHSQYIFPSGYEEQQLSQSVPIHLKRYSNVLPTPTKMQQIADKVNWSPNRTKNRGQRKKQEKRKQEESSPWILQSPNEIIQKQ